LLEEAAGWQKAVTPLGASALPWGFV